MTFYRRIKLKYPEIVRIQFEADNYNLQQVGQVCLHDAWLNPELSVEYEVPDVGKLISCLHSTDLVNIICREYWRKQDLPFSFNYTNIFAGWVFNHIKDVDYNTSPETFNRIMVKMAAEIEKDRDLGYYKGDLVNLYHQVK